MDNPENFLTVKSQMVSSEVEQWFMHTNFVIPNWKWLAIAAIFISGLLLRPLFQYIIGKLKSAAPDKWQSRKNFGYYYLSQRIEQPLSWLLLCFLWNFGKDAIGLLGNFDKYTGIVLTAMTGYYAIKLVYLAVDALGHVLNDIVAKTESTVDDQLAPFATKTLKILVVILGSLMIFQGFGLNVVSLLAGLGIGGLAIAFAAQDTVANVFGSITILMDRPFKIGDWIKVQDVEGTVEEIGFRSTRIRTFYNSAVAIPNAVVAKEKVDNMGERPYRRIRHTLEIHYDTTPATIQQFCQEIVAKVKSYDDKIIPDSVFAYFNGYGASALTVLTNFNVRVNTGDEELKVQQKYLLDVLEIAKKLEVDFAYPTRTVYHRSLDPIPQLLENPNSQAMSARQ